MSLLSLLLFIWCLSQATYIEAVMRIRQMYAIMRNMLAVPRSIG
jgi:hypothetical protein